MQRRATLFWLLIAVSAFVSYVPGVRGQEAAATTPPAEESVRPGINDRFLDSELDVQEWLDRFEVESREIFANREAILLATALGPGDRVADIGAGTGLFSKLFSQQVGADGWVYAVDISPKFIEHITARAQADGIENLTAVMCSTDSITLPEESIDVAFICDTYHHFEFPQKTLASIHRALRPGGRLIVIDFERIPGVSREFILGHVRAGKDVFRQEIVSAGFEFAAESRVGDLSENYFLVFTRPAVEAN